MQMYFIIGADGKQYGPVSADQLRHWLAEGRVNGQTLVQAEGQAWQPLAAYPEFAEALATKLGVVSAPPGFEPGPGLPEDLLARDYDLDIGGCVGTGWRLLSGNFGMLFGGVAIFIVIQLVMWVLGYIPLLGIVVTLASLVITGPMTGGLWYFILRNLRRQPAEVGDVFAGFQLAFGQLVLGYLAVAFLTGLAALPGALVMAFPIYVMVQNNAPDPTHALIALAGLPLVMLPMLYLGVSWTFALPLIIDRRMKFWPAMELSRRMIGKHWWVTLGLIVVCGLINLAGLAACCVGVFISAPISLAAMMQAYETIFSGATPQTR